jgi:hypothetical protein
LALKVPYGYHKAGNGDSTTIFEVKGYATPIWKLKRKMMAHFYPHVHIEVV